MTVTATARPFVAEIVRPQTSALQAGELTLGEPAAGIGSYAESYAANIQALLTLDVLRPRSADCGTLTLRSSDTSVAVNRCRRERMEDERKKTLIGMLASHDDRTSNVAMADVLVRLFTNSARCDVSQFHFVVTGGTWRRLSEGAEALGLSPLPTEVLQWLLQNTTIVPPA